MYNYILNLACYDQPNLILKVCEFITRNFGNIIEMEQHVDQTEEIFFLRVSWETAVNKTSSQLLLEFKQHMSISMISCDFYLKNKSIRMAILVSKLDHCLFEIIMRNQNKEWPATIPIVISNHPDLEDLCLKFQIPFKHMPICGDKADQEKEVIRTLKEHDIELVVLARYMQILSGNFVNSYPNSIINIHHSFLPAFIGAKPYHQAHKQGVKMVGATSHYVTEELDRGPIICQDITSVDHSHDIKDLILMGKDVEKKVLCSALKAHLERRIIIFKNKTVVFR